MTSIREQILENLAQAIDTITFDNGYSRDYPVPVQRYLTSGRKLAKLPARSVYWISPETLEPDGGGFSCSREFVVEIWDKHDEDADPISTETYMDPMITDIQKAVMVDPARGGLAEETMITQTEMQNLLMDGEEAYSVGFVTGTVVYSVAFDDPEAQ